jgi:hypothetical protein
MDQQTKDKCTCGNPKLGFDCVCEWVRNHPGMISYCCEYCGCYTASAKRCNRCREEEIAIADRFL